MRSLATSAGAVRTAARAALVMPVLAVALVLVLVTGGCASGERRLPEGTALGLVRAAPSRTLDLAGAAVAVAEPTALRRATVDFAEPLGQVEAAAVAGLDLLRGVVDADKYGGQSVRGVSTLRLDVTVDLEKAIAATPPARRAELVDLRDPDAERTTFESSLWVDIDGRVRRFLRSTEPMASPPATVGRGVLAMVTIDYFDFRAAP